MQIHSTYYLDQVNQYWIKLLVSQIYLLLCFKWDKCFSRTIILPWLETLKKKKNPQLVLEMQQIISQDLTFALTQSHLYLQLLVITQQVN